MNELAFQICTAITLTSAVAATFVQNMRQCALALTACGMGLGGIYLSLGAEVLSVAQWICSVLVGVSFYMYSSLFGSTKEPINFVGLALGVLVAGLFAGTLWVSVHNVTVDLSTAISQGVENGPGLAQIGSKIIQDELISVEILGVILFLVVVGAGVVARPEKRGRS